MSVMPLPHFQTLYLHNTGGVQLTHAVPSIGEFGRLHFNRAELAQLAEQERKRIRQMAFGLVKKSELPVTQVGRVRPTKPAVGVAVNGRMVFNTLINEAWKAVPVSAVVMLHDPDTGKVAIIGLKDGEKPKIKGFDMKDAFIPTISQPSAEGAKSKKKGGDYSLAAAGFLKNVANYDYATAGNQSFDAEWNEQMKGYIFTLPKETPKAKPVVARKKREEKKEEKQEAKNPTNNLPVNTEAPAEDDLILT